MTSHLKSPREIDYVKKKFFCGNLLRMGWTTYLPSFKVLNTIRSEIIMGGGIRPPPPVQSTLQKPGINRVNPILDAPPPRKKV